MIHHNHSEPIVHLTVHSWGHTFYVFRQKYNNLYQRFSLPSITDCPKNLCSDHPVQDGGVEGWWVSPPARAPKSQLVVKQPLTGEQWNPLKKDTLCPKTKKPPWDGRRGANMIKSNPIPAGWATHKLENNNIKVLPLLWRFWAPCQASHSGDPAKGLGILRESNYLIVVLICISIIPYGKGVDHFFICLFATCVSSLLWYLIRSLAHFLISLFSCWILKVFVYFNRPLSEVSLADILS